MLLHLELLELKASGCTQDRPSALDDVRHIHGFHFKNLFVEQALVAPHNTLDLDLVRQRFTYNRTDCCIHSRSVAAACQHADCIEFFFFFHKHPLFVLINYNRELKLKYKQYYFDFRTSAK